jgi:hypothetical protein
VARFTDLLREGTQIDGYDPGGADCAIAWLPPGGTIGLDEVTLYVGRLDTIDPADEATVRLQSTSREGGATIPILDAAVMGDDGDLFPGVYIDWGFRGLELDADFGATFPATCSNNPGSCGGPPSFDSGELTAEDLNGTGFELLIDYTIQSAEVSALGAWAFETRYAGFYRALDAAPGNLLSFDLVQTHDSKFGIVVEDSPTVDADLEIIGVPTVGSLAALQANDHDTIDALAATGTILGTFSTGSGTLAWTDPTYVRIAPPLSVAIGNHRLILFRIKSSSYPPIPPQHPVSTVKHFTDIVVQNFLLGTTTMMGVTPVPRLGLPVTPAFRAARTGRQLGSHRIP